MAKFLGILLAVLQELVWESVAIMNRQVQTEIPVVFEDVRFHRATIIPKEGKYCGAVVWSFMIALMHVDCLMCFVLRSYQETAYSNTDYFHNVCINFILPSLS